MTWFSGRSLCSGVMERLFHQRWFVTRLNVFLGPTVLAAVPRELGCDRELREVATRVILPDLVDSDTDSDTRAILPDMVDSDTDTDTDADS